MIGLEPAALAVLAAGDDEWAAVHVRRLVDLDAQRQPGWNTATLLTRGTFFSDTSLFGTATSTGAEAELAARRSTS